jgi:anti-sigma regulatory factor (Ser/Thr protein kinase)
MVESKRIRPKGPGPETMGKKPKSVSFKLKNALSELDTLYRKLEYFGKTIGLSKRCLFQVNLALDELFTNIVSYGFEKKGSYWIDIVLTHQDGTILIRVEDNGAPFDPVSKEMPEPENTLEKCRVGGLGLHIVKKMMDDIVYQRTEGKNVITMTKRISSS